MSKIHLYGTRSQRRRCAWRSYDLFRYLHAADRDQLIQRNRLSVLVHLHVVLDHGQPLLVSGHGDVLLDVNGLWKDRIVFELHTVLSVRPRCRPWALSFWCSASASRP